MNRFNRIFFWIIFLFGLIGAVNAEDRKCLERPDNLVACDQIFQPRILKVYASQPIRGSVMDIKWAGDSTVIVRAINTLSGYRLEGGVASQYFQFDIPSTDDRIISSDIAVSANEKWLVFASRDIIRIVDLTDGQVRFERKFDFVDKTKFVSAVALVDRAFVKKDNSPILAYVITNGKKSQFAVTSVFNKMPPCQTNPCGIVGGSERIDLDPVERDFDGVVTTIFPKDGVAILDGGVAGFEGFLRMVGCESSFAISSAIGNPKKTIKEVKNLFPCRQFHMPFGKLTIDFLAQRKFPDLFADSNEFDPITPKQKVLMLAAYPERCVGIQVYEVLQKSGAGWQTKPLNCIKDNFVARDITVVQFSASGKHFALGGIDSEFVLLNYPSLSRVEIQ
jgi:hypothetical protein